MEAFAKSDVGKARDMNQDFYYIPKEEDTLKVCILADGMGGYKVEKLQVDLQQLQH